MDYYNPLFYKLFVQLITYKYYWNKITGKRNKITVTGDLQNLHSLRNSVNTIYTAKFKNINDYIYYSFAINKFILPVPRFFVPSETIKSRLHKYLLRKSGGFIIHQTKLNNMLYLECVMEYLSTLISHGVPFLYFPELQGVDSDLPATNEKFFNMLNNVMFKETTEVVLIPSEITYKNRVNDSEIKESFTETGWYQFLNTCIFIRVYQKIKFTDFNI